MVLDADTSIGSGADLLALFLLMVLELDGVVAGEVSFGEVVVEVAEAAEELELLEVLEEAELDEVELVSLSESECLSASDGVLPVSLSVCVCGVSVLVEVVSVCVSECLWINLASFLLSLASTRGRCSLARGPSSSADEDGPSISISTL